MATYSTNLALTLQSTGENPGTWGDVTNTNLGTLVEQAISGYTTQAMNAATDVTLSMSNGASSVARNMFIECTGSMSQGNNLVVPTNRKLYFVYNNTSGGFAVTVKTSAGTGIAVPSAQKALLVCDGTNVVNAVTYFNSFATSSISNTPISGSTGSFTTLAASSTVSGTGFSAYLASPPAIGGLSANTINGTTITASTQFSGPHNGTVGATTPNTGVFTSLTCTSANVTVNLSPTGTGTVTVNPATAGTLNNVSIGVTTAAGGRFTFAHTAPVAVTFSATAMAVDCALSNVFTTTFTANVTTAPTFSNLKDGQTINWFITQDATGSRTMTWPTSFKWPGGTAGVLSTAANSVDLVVATYRSATGFWYATLSKAFA